MVRPAPVSAWRKTRAGLKIRSAARTEFGPTFAALQYRIRLVRFDCNADAAGVSMSMARRLVSAETLRAYEQNNFRGQRAAPVCKTTGSNHEYV
jgi:hypothetical protein